jgi:hypothetical protein
VRALSPVELACLVSVGGSVLAVVVPTFARNVHASYVSEATRGVSDLSARTSALLEAAQATSALPESAPLTPASVPRGTRSTDPAGTWEHPTWRALEFGFDEAHAYSFAYDAERASDVAKWSATAHGDLDGDGNLSTIQLGGVYRPGSAPVLSPMDVQHEIE